MQIRTPDYVSIYVEGGNESFAYSNCVIKEDVKVEAFLQNEQLHVDLTADETPVKYISLRWNFAEGEKRGETVKVYGDVW